jgi:glycine/D-amino acid oxidase-like deaminating enzyme
MTRTKYGVSPWVHLFPKSRRFERPRFAPAARQPAKLPVVIVGGGLTGCCTAYALAAAGVKTILLEADRVALAGAARSAGILQAEPAASYRDVEARHGRRAARAMFEASRAAVRDLAATVKRLGIKADLEVHDALRFTPPFSGDEKAFAREIAARETAGLDAVSLRGAAAARAIAIERVSAAVRFHDWGQADPYRLAVGFARAASARGAAIYERSPVLKIKGTRTSVEVVLKNGAIAADTVIICTGEPTDLFRALKRHVRFEERYAVLTETVSAPMRKQIAARTRVTTDTAAPPHVIRWTSDERLVVSGAGQPRPHPRDRGQIVVQRTGQLMYELLRMYPAISGLMPEYGWDEPIATTADGVMYAGPHRNYPGHLFAWATRHDPAQAFLASRILLRHVLGEVEKEDAYFAFTRG